MDITTGIRDKPMMGMKFTATADDGKDMTTELIRFADFIGLERVAPGRYSILLTISLFVGLKSGQLNPAKVIREIEALEGFGEPSQLKPPTPFNHPLLKGLRHKHYLEDGVSTTKINLEKGMKIYGMPLIKQRVCEARKAGEERYFSVNDVEPLVNDIVYGNWMRLATSQALTGEWIIYAQYEGLNYYLCLGKHESGDEYLRKQIDTICLHEFPFIETILPPIVS